MVQGLSEADPELAANIAMVQPEAYEQLAKMSDKLLPEKKSGAAASVEPLLVDEQLAAAVSPAKVGFINPHRGALVLSCQTVVCLQVHAKPATAPACSMQCMQLLLGSAASPWLPFASKWPIC